MEKLKLKLEKNVQKRTGRLTTLWFSEMEYCKIQSITMKKYWRIWI